jgi:polar amino acid transport system substrate-binding protein
MWLYGGFEKLTVNSHEVENPTRAFPIALGIAVPLCALSYFLPTLAALAANGDWQDWGESHYVASAAAIGGKALGTAMAFGGLVSNAVILMVTILAQSRLPMVLARSGFFPESFRTLHPIHGTPVASLVLTGVVITALCGVPFAQLAGVYSLVQSLSYLLIYAALFRLRSRGGALAADGFRIPVGRVGLALMVAPSVLLVALVIRQGIWPGGVFDRSQAFLDLAIFTSGPLTYLLFRALRTMPARAALVTLLALGGGGTSAFAQKAEPVRVGMDTRSRPWAYVPGLDYSREDWTKPPQILPAQLRRLEGVDIDLMKALGQRMRRPLVVVPYAWEDIEEGLLAQRYDMILNAWVPSDRTPSAIIASSAYYEFGLLVAVRAEEMGIHSYRDLAGRRVGHFRDRVIDRTVQGLSASTLVAVEDSDELFDLLAAGKVDAAVEDSTYVRWRVARDRRFQVVGERLNKMGYCLALRREDRALYEQVQAAIKELLASGDVEAIRQRWESPEPSGGARR